jgi:hypothetical protein
MVPEQRVGPEKGRSCVAAGKTAVLRPRGHNEDRWPDVAPAARVVRALLESAGTSSLPLLLVQHVAVESTECLVKLKLKLSYDLLSVSQSVCLGVGLPSGTRPDFSV